jgi:hypothetical protein
MAMAAPPGVIRIDEKHRQEYSVPNVCGVIITTNYRTGGLYLPADDRRHYVAWSEARGESFGAGYFDAFYSWYENDGGFEHVAAFLATLDLSGFDAKAPPPKTDAFWAMVNAEQSEQEQDLADLVEALGSPDAFTLEDLRAKAADVNPALHTFLTDRNKGRALARKLGELRYAPVVNPTNRKDGRWLVRSVKQTVYARTDLPEGARKNAAARL